MRLKSPSEDLPKSSNQVTTSAQSAHSSSASLSLPSCLDYSTLAMSDPLRPTQPRTEAPPGLDTPGLVLLYGSTPNGWKITYALQALKEAGLIPDYTVVEVYLETGEQFQPWFRNINPNSSVSLFFQSLRARD